MNPNPTPPPLPPASDPVRARDPKRRSWLLYIFGAVVALLLIIVASVAITLWWIQRPIKPVVLSAAEKAKVEEKLERLDDSATNRASTLIQRDTAPKPELDRTYEAGSKELRLTERELNGLLNLNTELGKTVRLELGQDAINAYLVVPIPEDFPIGGGKMFRARGRFRVSITDGAAPFAILEDVTVFGLSLPKEWLGGLKGENLIANAMGDRSGTPVLHGVKSLRIVPGAIVLEVGD